MTPFQKQVKQVATAAGFEKIVCKSNGTVEVIHEYFFRPAGGATVFAERVSNTLRNANITKIQIDTDDRFGQRLSKLVAIVKAI
jgi:hypothetical protein